MGNFFKNSNREASNPFAQKVENAEQNKNKEETKSSIKRLNINDTEVLNINSQDTSTEFLEIKMNNLYQIIHQYPQTLDPISLEKVKMEWEDLRDKVYNSKTLNHKKHFIQKNKYINITNFFKNNLFNFATFLKFYSPKIKKILNTFNDINKEVEDLMNRATPVGEENIKYGILVNRLYQASKLNEKITNEIK